MNRPPAFQFYPGDFLSDPKTLIMSAEEIGVYWLLICACWKDDGLSPEIKKLSRLARVQEKKFSRLWEDSISKCFYFNEETKRFRHHRLDEELEKQALNSAKRQKAANARWMQMHSKCIAPEMQVECSSSSSSSSSSEGKEIHVEPAEVSVAEAPGQPPAIPANSIEPDGQPPAVATQAQPKASRASESFAPKVREIFAYWQSVMNHQAAKLTDKRRRSIEARLREGYGADQIKRAIDGCRLSPFHQGTGEGSDGTVYDDIELICRDGSKVESFEKKFLTRSSRSNGHQPSALVQRNQAAAAGAYELLFGEKFQPEPAIDAEVIQ